MFYLRLGNFFTLTLRVTFGLRNFLQNWDIDLGWWTVSYCWHRQHRLGVSKRFIIKHNGRLFFNGQKQYWAFGHNFVWDDEKKWIRKIGPIWRFALPDRSRGEVTFDRHLLEPVTFGPKISLNWHETKCYIVFWFRHNIVDRIRQQAITAN